jgi:hypothetical protein
MRIFKYPLEIAEVQKVILHAAYKLLTVQMQHGKPVLWAMVSAEDTRRTEIEIRVLGTGQESAWPGEYLGTVQEADGNLIWHFFHHTGFRGV